MTQVIIDDVIPRTQLLAAAGQTVFNTNWTANATTDVMVYARADGVEPDDETQLVSTSDYNVTFIGGSQTVRVTFLVGRALDDVITIVRNTPAERLNLYINTNFVPSMLNEDFGILTLVDQQAQMYDTVIAPHYNVSATIDPDSLIGGGDVILPILPPKFGWRKNADGTAIEAIAIPDGGFAPQVDSFVTVSDERTDLPNSFPLFDLGNASTSGMGIPAGTTDQRVVPTSPNIGLRFNTDLEIIEAYIGGQWVEIPSSSAGLFLPLAGGTMSGIINMSGNRITNLGNPIDVTDAATVDFVLSTAAGRYFVAPVRVSATANLSATYNNGASGVGATLTASANGVATLDSVVLNLNDRVIFPFQTTSQQNGIYIVTNVGSVGTQAIYTRADDYNQPSDIDPGDTIGVTEGSIYAGAFFMQIATVTTIGTDPISFIISVNPNVVTIDGTQTITGQKTFIAPNLGTPASGDATNLTHTGGLRSFQILTTGVGATYTKPVYASSLMVEVWGGGGGGGSASAAVSQSATSGGGGAGGYARLYIPSPSPSYTFTVGAAGAPGLNSDGGAGGTTTFSASSLQATGGAGGSAGTSVPATATFPANGGIGGIGSNGDINTRGAYGLPGLTLVNNNLSFGGASSSVGSGGQASNSAGTGASGNGYASGGAGSVSLNASNYGGGAGTGGLIIVWEYS